MNKIKKQFKNQTGVILLLTLFILSGILIITLGAADLVMSGIKMNRLTGYSNLSFFASEAGVERALWEARKNNFVLPDVDTPNIFSFSLGNQGTYQIDYSTSSPNVTFTATGSYQGAKRSVESTYSTLGGTGGANSCLPSCDGKDCGDDGCGSVCGTCGENELCLFGSCLADSRVYTCADKPASNTEWNTVSLYIQTWNGSAWLPANSTTAYNATADTASCRYTCASGYYWGGSVCIPNNRTYTCAATPGANTVYNTVSSYTQTWNGSAWSPADDATTEYNATADTASCRYTCATNYTWNGTICAADTKTYTCTAKAEPNTVYNTVSSYTQTWTGSTWSPADDATTEYNATASSVSCRFICALGYGWSGTVCAPLSTGGTITYTDSNGLNPRSSQAYAGGYTIHTFTADGTFTPSIAGNVSVLVVAGGGGGGMDMGGGGGGGGVVYNSSYAVTPVPINVKVGLDGAGAPAAGTTGQLANHWYSIGSRRGSNSSFNNTITYGSSSVTAGKSCYSLMLDGITADGVYWIDPDGAGANTPFQVYCDMTYDGGGWTMLMKATTGTTFQYNATYWTTNNTLNPTDITRNNADAKYRSFNESPVTDIMARWPDAGDIRWLHNNAWTARVALTGFNEFRNWGNHTTARYWNSTYFSSQVIQAVPPGPSAWGTKLAGLGGILAGSRWGFRFNENGAGEWNSDDAGGGIGIAAAGNIGPLATTGASAGDSYGCCGTTGMNRTARVEVYGRNIKDVADATITSGIVAIGGGFGGSSYATYSPGIEGGSGGSGGGSGAYNPNTGTYYGGVGTSGQGYSGGNSISSYYGGGGGGAGGAGAGSNSIPHGGAGVLNAINGNSYYWGGGGGGSGYSACGGNGGIGGGGGGAVCTTTGGGSALNSGSAGGGGTIATQTNTPGGNAGINTGGGGGGGSNYNSNNNGGAGGSGIVIIKYSSLEFLFRTYTCAAKPATGTVYNTVSSYTQTWNGSAWSPADDATTEYNATADTTSCRYKCSTGYAWDGTTCIPLSYGTGADGNVTISSNTTLTVDKNYNNLTVNAGVTLNTAGFVVKVFDTLTNNGIITDSSSGGAGGAGGAAIAAGTGAGVAGNVPVSGSAGSKTGAGSGGQGGGGGARGGGALASTANNASGGAGGVGATGGKGGGVVRVYATNFINNGTVHANGVAASSNAGAGGNGTLVSETIPATEWVPEAYFNAAGGGGGGGGGANGGAGGTVELKYKTRTVGTVTANGGAASNGATFGSGGGTLTYAGTTSYVGAAGGSPRGGASGDGEIVVGASHTGSAGSNGSAGSAGSATWTYYAE